MARLFQNDSLKSMVDGWEPLQSDSWALKPCHRHGPDVGRMNLQAIYGDDWGMVYDCLAGIIFHGFRIETTMLQICSNSRLKPHSKSHENPIQNPSISHVNPMRIPWKFDQNSIQKSQGFPRGFPCGYAGPSRPSARCPPGEAPPDPAGWKGRFRLEMDPWMNPWWMGPKVLTSIHGHFWGKTMVYESWMSTCPKFPLLDENRGVWNYRPPKPIFPQKDMNIECLWQIITNSS